MKKITITPISFGEYDSLSLKFCRKKGFKVIMNPYGRKPSSKELIVLAEDAVGLIAGTESINKNVLLNLPTLKVISRCGVGVDNIDMEIAKELGIKVFNTPNAPTLAVTEMTVGLIINLLRKINRMDADIRNGKWDKLMGNLLFGKKVGIIGFGRIGKKVALLLEPFGCKVAYFDPFVKDKRAKRTSLVNLLKQSDIITIHASSKEEILGKKELNLMKKTALLVNLSRGSVLNEKAAYEALRDNRLAGAALDVFRREPYNGPLIKMDNVILTPHIGSYAKESRIRMEMEAVKNLLKGLRAKRSP